MYQAHPSRVLTELFARRPYQGVPPETAMFLFVGLDANYAADAERSTIFPALLSYHEDGPTFWRKHGVHHPFLLPEYTGDGRRYHRTFAKIGFRPDHADLVSFIELLHVPTVGRSTLVPDDLDSTHLSRLKDAMFAGQARYVFLSAGVVRLMNATGQFRELERASGPSGSLRTLYEDDARTIFLHLHFSNYGKFEAQLQAEARGIAALLPRSPLDTVVTCSSQLTSLRFQMPDQDAGEKRFRYTVEGGWHVFTTKFEIEQGPSQSDDIKTLVKLVSALRAKLGDPGDKAGPGWFGVELSRWSVRMAVQRTETTNYVLDVSTGQLLNEDASRYVKGWRYICVLTFQYFADAHAFVETYWKGVSRNAETLP